MARKVPKWPSVVPRNFYKRKAEASKKVLLRLEVRTKIAVKKAGRNIKDVAVFRK